MFHKGTSYVGCCPQCRRGLDGVLNRLVTDGCGHAKCRFCLLQEMNGCLKCCAERKKVGSIDSEPKQTKDVPPVQPNPITPLRKSVIMGPVKVKAEISENSTKHILEQSLESDILFPTDIVKKSTGGYFHLKRVISERYYSEKSEKEEKRAVALAEHENESLKLPRHIVHYCEIHGVLLRDATAVARHKFCKENCCDICKMTFSGLSKLQRHRRSHTPRRFTCTECAKHFKDNYARRIHKRIHSGVKLYKCNICHAQLKQLYGYKRHMVAHKGEKQFGCDKCEYKAMTKGELNKHVKTHNNNKCYECNVCGLRFSFKRTMLRHCLSHDPKSKLECALCGASFKRKDNLTRHQKNAHSADTSIRNPVLGPDTTSSVTTVFEFDKIKTQ